MYRVLSALLLCCCAVTLSGRDIDLEKHVKKYWTRWHNRQVEVADGSKRWPLTPELKRERLDHYKSALSKFAPHIVEETYIIDRAFNWKKGTYLGILRFGARNIKIVPDVPKPPHECTSWVTMDNLIILALLGLILGGAAGYIYKAKKKGVKCIDASDSFFYGCSSSR